MTRSTKGSQETHYRREHVKERHLHARHTVSFRNKAEAPFGLESFELEALDGLMAERKRRGHLLRRKLNLT